MADTDADGNGDAGDIPYADAPGIDGYLGPHQETQKVMIQRLARFTIMALTSCLLSGCSMANEPGSKKPAESAIAAADKWLLQNRHQPANYRSALRVGPIKLEDVIRSSDTKTIEKLEASIREKEYDVVIYTKQPPVLGGVILVFVERKTLVVIATYLAT
jgi:hypothetical protein